MDAKTAKRLTEEAKTKIPDIVLTFIKCTCEKGHNKVKISGEWGNHVIELLRKKGFKVVDPSNSSHIEISW